MNRRALGIVDEQHGLQACARPQGVSGIVEQGRHDDLMHDEGLYADLYRTLLRGDTEGFDRTP